MLLGSKRVENMESVRIELDRIIAAGIVQLIFISLRIFSLSYTHTTTQTHTSYSEKPCKRTKRFQTTIIIMTTTTGEWYIAIESLILLLNRATPREKKEPKQKKKKTTQEL